MRTTVRIDDRLLARAKEVAARSGRTLAAVIEDALRAALASPRRGARREPVTLPTFGEGGLVPGVDLDDTARLLEVMEAGGDPY